MTKWEYVYIEWSSDIGMEIEKPRGVEINPPDRPDFMTFWEFLNELGNQGWELVNHSVVELSSIHAVSLKRPKN